MVTIVTWAKNMSLKCQFDMIISLKYEYMYTEKKKSIFAQTNSTLFANVLYLRQI